MVKRARAAVTVAFVTNGFVVGAFIARIPDFKQILGLRDGQLGTALHCSSIGLLIGLGPSGRLSARRGSAWVADLVAISLTI